MLGTSPRNFRGRAVVFAILLGAAATSLRAETLVRLADPQAKPLQAAGFELTEPTDVRISAVGMVREPSFLQPWIGDSGPDDDNTFLVYAWVLDAASRTPVWQLERTGSAWRSGNRLLRETDATVRLDPGRYELYLFSLVHAGVEPGADAQQARGFWGRTLDYFSGSEPEAVAGDCYAELSRPATARGEVRRFEVTGDLPGALVRLNRLGDSQRRAVGLDVGRRARLRLYGLVEWGRSGRVAADFGWIVNEATREIVWEPTPSKRRPAGGHPKNGLIDETIALEPGRYILYHGTDDSHAFPEFNAPPPHDPYNWGITLFPAQAADASAVAPFVPVEAEPLAELRKVGDDQALERPFALAQETTVHVRALGECVDGDCVDQASILEAGSRRTVWTMTEDATRPAGGADKNRLFDGTLRLPAGKYILAYRSDDSHSFGHWNNSPPFDPAAWGISVRPTPAPVKPAGR